MDEYGTPSASALSNGIQIAFCDDNMATPKASTDRLDVCEPDALSASTPSSASVASSNTTALSSPDLPGPAANFGTVEHDGIYRSSFPKILNFEHMRELRLKTILYVYVRPGFLVCAGHVTDG